MATEKRYIDANAIPWEEYYVPDPDSNAQWDYKKELSVTKPVIDQMPTADAVEVVHGRWRKYTDDRFNGYDNAGRIRYRKVYSYECSNCGRNVAVKSNYCPNCGAKMDGDGNGT